MIPETIVVCKDRKSHPKTHGKTTNNLFLPPPERKDNSSCHYIGFAYEPIPCCSSYKLWQATIYNTWLSDLSTIGIFSENRCMNGCNVLLSEYRVEDCLELNFRYVDYQPLAHLSYSSYVCWRCVKQ